MPTNRTEPHGRKPSAALPSLHDHALPRAWGGGASSRVHTRLATSVARMVRRALRRGGSFSLGQSGHSNLAMGLRAERRTQGCADATSEPIWLSLVGIALAMACAAWGGGLLP